MVGALALAIACALPGPAALVHAPGAAAHSEDERQIIAPVIVESRAVAATDVMDALRLRLPEREFIGVEQPRPAADHLGYVRLVPKRGAMKLELILWDGRAFYRSLEATTDQIPREAATALANLLAGIEAGQLEPDATGVSLPEPEPEPTPEPEPEPEEAPQELEPIPEPEPEPRYDLGWVVAPEVTLGLGPPSAPGFAAGGVAAHFDMRWKKGALFSFGVRGAGFQNSGYGLVRVRVSVGGGYVYRKGAFEMLTAVSADIEPFLVGGEDLARDDGQTAGAAVLLGGHLRLVPAYRYVPPGAKWSFRVGPRIDVGGAATTAAGGGVVRLRVRQGDNVVDVFRLGGFELSYGLEFGMWFGRL